MKLEEAKEILQKDIDNPGGVAIEDVNEAERLGIEALKFLTTCKLDCPLYIKNPLPGETED